MERLLGSGAGNEMVCLLAIQTVLAACLRERHEVRSHNILLNTMPL